MNILTKISIVVLVVLVLVVSAAFITLATITPAYRDAYDKEKAKTAMMALMANQKEAALSSAVAQLNKALNDRLAAETATIAAKREGDEKALKLQGDLDQANRNNADLKGQVALLSVSVKSEADLISAFKVSNDELKKQADLLAVDNGKLQQKFQEAEGKADRLSKQIDVDMQNIKDLQDQIVALKTRGATPAGGGTVEGPSSIEEPRYTGTITAVKNDLASINIGSANGVKQGDRLFVYRGSKFVAYLRVERVDANDSAGVITEKQVDPMQGDKVTNKLQ
ncbi:MAG: FlgT C-terminal domain-containing protein [Phycisphaerae bacterium]